MSTYAFVNPVVAIVLGALLLGEDINATMLIGAALIVVAVAIVVRTESRQAPVPRRAGGKPAPDAA